MYKFAEGVEFNLDQSTYWYKQLIIEKASLRTRLQKTLVEYLNKVPQDYQTIKQAYFREIYEYSEIAFAIGINYWDKQDIYTAIKWFNESYDFNYRTSLYVLMLLYGQGHDVQRSPQFMIERMKAVSELSDDKTIQMLLGNVYLNGYGVEPNIEIAMTWLVKAATKGQIDAEEILAKMYREQVQVPDNDELKKSYLDIVCHQDVLTACDERDKLDKK